jgi:hypothetical protein
MAVAASAALDARANYFNYCLMPSAYCFFFESLRS